MANYKKYLKKIYWFITPLLPYGKIIFETKDTQTRVTWKYIFFQKILGFNRCAYWPVHFTSSVGNIKNIYAGIETCPGYMPGCYIQGNGKIYIDDYTQIAANVGIITANHDVYCSKNHAPARDVRIGKYGWIGMNSTILPGVELGDFTVVGAGSVVTKSFPEGYCIIAGNPAKIIRKLEKEKCIFFKSEYEYNGYVEHINFEQFRKKYLDV